MKAFLEAKPQEPKFSVFVSLVISFHFALINLLNIFWNLVDECIDTYTSFREDFRKSRRGKTNVFDCQCLSYIENLSTAALHVNCLMHFKAFRNLRIKSGLSQHYETWILNVKTKVLRPSENYSAQITTTEIIREYPKCNLMNINQSVKNILRC